MKNSFIAQFIKFIAIVCAVFCGIFITMRMTAVWLLLAICSGILFGIYEQMITGNK